MYQGTPSCTSYNYIIDIHTYNHARSFAHILAAPQTQRTRKAFPQRAVWDAADQHEVDKLFGIPALKQRGPRAGPRHSSPRHNLFSKKNRIPSVSGAEQPWSRFVYTSAPGMRKGGTSSYTRRCRILSGPWSSSELTSEQSPRRSTSSSTSRNSSSRSNAAPQQGAIHSPPSELPAPHLWRADALAVWQLAAGCERSGL